MSDKDFIIDGGDYFFIDRIALETLQEEQNQIKAQQQADAESRRRAAADSITF